MNDIDNPDGEFLPLPYFPWDIRPSTSSLETEECATALFLTTGDLDEAASKLRVHPLRLIRAINRSPRLMRLHKELTALLNNKVHQEYVKAFASDDDRRREWAAAKVANTKQFQEHPLAPNSNGASALTASASVGRIVISWEEGPVIEHESSGDE